LFPKEFLLDSLEDEFFDRNSELRGSLMEGGITIWCKTHNDFRLSIVRHRWPNWQRCIWDNQKPSTVLRTAFLASKLRPHA
jgi:hypothetical protein